MLNRLHHLITLACNKSCHYCINELKEFGSPDNRRHASLDAIEAQYASLSKRYTSVRISGGEPTKYKKFADISRLARKYFANVELITANAEVFTNSFAWVDDVYDSMHFSLHEPYIEEFYDSHLQEKFLLRNERKISVALSCLTDLFERLVIAYDSQAETLLQNMMRNGFQGLIIREEWPNGKVLKCNLPAHENFYVYYNPKQQCESQMLLMPDLSIIDNTEVTIPVRIVPVTSFHDRGA